MAYTELRAVPEQIRGFRDFDGNSVTGRKILYRKRLFYVVWSYATPILGISIDDGECILNKTRYSVTTSRHQGLVQNAIDKMDFLGSAIELYSEPRGNFYGFLAKFF